MLQHTCTYRLINRQPILYYKQTLLWFRFSWLPHKSTMWYQGCRPLHETRCAAMAQKTCMWTACWFSAACAACRGENYCCSIQPPQVLATYATMRHRSRTQCPAEPTERCAGIAGGSCPPKPIARPKGQTHRHAMGSYIIRLNQKIFPCVYS